MYAGSGASVGVSWANQGLPLSPSHTCQDRVQTHYNQVSSHEWVHVVRKFRHGIVPKTWERIGLGGGGGGSNIVLKTLLVPSQVNVAGLCVPALLLSPVLLACCVVEYRCVLLHLTSVPHHETIHRAMNQEVRGLGQATSLTVDGPGTRQTRAHNARIVFHYAARSTEWYHL